MPYRQRSSIFEITAIAAVACAGIMLFVMRQREKPFDKDINDDDATVSSNSSSSSSSDSSSQDPASNREDKASSSSIRQQQPRSIMSSLLQSVNDGSGDIELSLDEEDQNDNLLEHTTFDSNSRSLNDSQKQQQQQQPDHSAKEDDFPTNTTTTAEDSMGHIDNNEPDNDLLLNETNIIESYNQALKGEQQGQETNDTMVQDDFQAPTTTKDIVGDGATTNITKFVNVFLPMADRTPKSRQLRNEVWPLADLNQNNHLSLSDVERWVQKTLEREMGMLDGKNVFRNYFPACIHAFREAQTMRTIMTDSSSSHEEEEEAKIMTDANNNNNHDNDDESDSNDDCITRSEFRLLIANMCAYSLMYDAYNQINNGGSKSGIRLEEFLRDYPLVSNHGLVAFDHISKLTTMNGGGAQQRALLAKHIFNQIDESGGGTISFGEWFVYLRNAEIQAHTKLGNLIQFQGPGGAIYSNKKSIIIPSDV